MNFGERGKFPRLIDDSYLEMGIPKSDILKKRRKQKGRDVVVNIRFNLSGTQEKTNIDKECGSNITYKDMSDEIHTLVLDALKSVNRPGVLGSIGINIKDAKTDECLILSVYS
jgi:hypothetical protein